MPPVPFASEILPFADRQTVAEYVSVELVTVEVPPVTGPVARNAASPALLGQIPVGLSVVIWGAPMTTVWLLGTQVSVPPDSRAPTLPVSFLSIFLSALGTAHLEIVTTPPAATLSLGQVRLLAAEAGTAPDKATTVVGTAKAVPPANRTMTIRRMTSPLVVSGNRIWRVSGDTDRQHLGRGYRSRRVCDVHGEGEGAGLPRCSRNRVVPATEPETRGQGAVHDAVVIRRTAAPGVDGARITLSHHPGRQRGGDHRDRIRLTRHDDVARDPATAVRPRAAL